MPVLTELIKSSFSGVKKREPFFAVDRNVS